MNVICAVRRSGGRESKLWGFMCVSAVRLFIMFVIGKENKMEYADDSILSAAEKCSTLCAVEYVLHLNAPGAKVAREAGSAIHDALKAFYGDRVGRTKALAVFSARYEDYARAYADEERLQHENVQMILDEYLKKNTIEAWAEKGMEVVSEEVERGAVAPLNNEVMFFAKVDVPIRDRNTGEKIPLDHKSTGKVSDWWLKKWGLGSQMTGYIWTYQQGEPNAGMRALINVLELGKLPTSNRKCSKHQMKYYECAPMHAKWQMVSTLRSPTALTHWYLNANRLWGKFKWIRGQMVALESVLALPMEGTFNNGCTFCDLREWCKMDRDVDYARRNFIEHRWAPWEGEE